MMINQQKAAWIATIAAFAILVGALYLAPSLLIKRAIERGGGIYLQVQLNHPLRGETLIWYVAPAKEVSEGRLLPSDVYIPENKDLPYLWPPLPPLLFGGLIALAGDANNAYLWAMFIFPILAFVVFTWLGWEFTKNKLSAVAVAILGTLTPIAYLHQTRHGAEYLSPAIIIKSFIPYVRTPISNLFLDRLYDPLIVMPFFVIAFVLLWRFWQEPSVKRGVTLALATAVLFYLYPHRWLFIVAFAGVLFISYSFSEQRRHFSGWLALAAVFLLLATPYLMNAFEFWKLPQAGEIAARFGPAVERGRGFRLSVWRDYLIYFILGGGLWWVVRDRNRQLFVFLAAAIATMFALWNIQLIFGFTPAPDHWHKVFALPLFVILLVLAAYGARRLHEYAGSRLQPIALTALLVLGLTFVVIKRTINAVLYIHPDERTKTAFTFPRSISDSWVWMNENLPPESVVLSNSYVTSLYLTGYTSANPYLPFAGSTLAPTKEVEDRFLKMHKLFGTSPELLEALLRSNDYGDEAQPCPQPCNNENTAHNFLKNPEMLYGPQFNPRTTFDQLRKANEYTIPEWKIAELLTRYKEIKTQWNDFRGNFVYYGPWERELVLRNLREEPQLDLIYANELIELYFVR